MGLVNLAILAAAIAAVAPDWTDCPAPCRCKWTSGKKTALCKEAGFAAIPSTLNGDMQVLDLSNNRITELHADAFHNVGLLNLQRIFLSNCSVTFVDGDAFKDLLILVEVDLSYNHISTIDPNTFRDNERLRILYLNGNPLKRLEATQFPQLLHLKTLELNDCMLEYIHRDAFVYLTALESLDLQHNLLQNISKSVFVTMGHLKTLKLENNPWKCDCELRDFRDWFLLSKLYSVPLTCTEPVEYATRKWETVASNQFACAPQVTISSPFQVQAETGDNVSLGCHVMGDPEPELTWYYDGYPINHTWLVMEIEDGLVGRWINISIVNVSESDAGVYSCAAKNALAMVSANVTLVLPEVVTATTVSKSDIRLVWWGVLAACVCVSCGIVSAIVAVCCIRTRGQRSRQNLKASVSFTDQEKKLLDVSIATTTDRGSGSCEALASTLEAGDGPVHITIESEPMPLAVFPPPPQFSTGTSLLPPTPPFGNIYISVSVGRENNISDTIICPDLLDLPHRTKLPYHGVATLPRRLRTIPHYDNMGPRVTADGSTTLCPTEVISDPVATTIEPSCATQFIPEFVSL